MKVAIMQPYFFPYIGYWQLIHDVDIFIVYDNIQYTKKGWINRNRLQINGTEKTFSISLKKDSDYLDISKRVISHEYSRKKLLNRISGAYSSSPYFSEIFPMIEELILFEENNLFRYIFNSIMRLSVFLEFATDIRISSEIEANHSLKGEDRVIDICRSLQADTYVNLSGGVALYNPCHFRHKGINLMFLRSESLDYNQTSEEFIPWLSIIDVLMFNGKKKVIETFIKQYDLFTPKPGNQVT